MNIADRPGKLVPGLATEWSVDPADQKKWRFKLREGVSFMTAARSTPMRSSGTSTRCWTRRRRIFDKRQSAQVKTRLPSVASWKKLDDMTVEITNQGCRHRSSPTRCSGS